MRRGKKKGKKFDYKLINIKRKIKTELTDYYNIFIKSYT